MESATNLAATVEPIAAGDAWLIVGIVVLGVLGALWLFCRSDRSTDI